VAFGFFQGRPRTFFCIGKAFLFTPRNELVDAPQEFSASQNLHFQKTGQRHRTALLYPTFARTSF
jgi:hypothetical protein